MQYRIIKAENYLLIVDDSEININQYVYCDLGYIEKVMDIIDGWIYHTNTLGKNPIKHYKKIIAHLPLNNSTILEGVDLLPPITKELTYEERIKWFIKNYYETGMEYGVLLETMKNMNLDSFKHYNDIISIPKYAPLEDDVEKLAEDYAFKTYHELEDAKWFTPLNVGFRAGYNKAKEKYKYTKEDMRKAFFSGGNFKDIEEFDYLIQSLQQPKYPIGFECELYEIQVRDINTHELIKGRKKTTTNSQGITEWVGKYIY